MFPQPRQGQELDGLAVASFDGSVVAAAAAGEGADLGRLTVRQLVPASGFDPLASSSTDLIRSDGRPTMAVFENQLWLAFRKNGKLYIMTSDDGRTFTAPTVAWDENNEGIAIGGPPSLAVFVHHLYVAFAAPDPNHPQLVLRTFKEWTRAPNSELRVPVFPKLSKTYPEVTFKAPSPVGPVSLSPFQHSLEASFRGPDGSLYVTVH